tara:strand:- start:279 stop:863 length:585 start_codon:yes stop_codon:yes gene_type:complete
MSSLLDKFEKQQIEKLTSKKRIPAFRPGDTVKVTVKITEGSKSRLQAFEGVCIARKNNSVNSNFTVRKISHGEGVERVFPLFSPIVDKIDVVRKGDVRRAKLYYLRDLSGKKARIADRDRGDEADQYEFIEEISKEEVKQTESIEENQSQPTEEAKSAEENQRAEKSKVEEAQPEDESKAENNQKAEDNSDESK